MARHGGMRLCAAAGDEAAVKVLLDDGADIEDRGYHGRHGCTPLMIAAHDGHTGVCRLLVERGAAIDAVVDHPGEWDHGRTALMYACTRHAPPRPGTTEGHPEICGLLLNAGADIHRAQPANAGGYCGWTALHHAVSFVRPTVVELMLQRGADPRSDHGGVTALELAQEWGLEPTDDHPALQDTEAVWRLLTHSQTIRAEYLSNVKRHPKVDQRKVNERPVPVPTVPLWALVLLVTAAVLTLATAGGCIWWTHHKDRREHHDLSTDLTRNRDGEDDQEVEAAG